MNWYAFAWTAIGVLATIWVRKDLGKLPIIMYFTITFAWPFWLMLGIIGFLLVALREFLKWEV